MFGLSPVELIALAGAGGYLYYTFFYTKGDGAAVAGTTTNAVNDFLKSLKDKTDFTASVESGTVDAVKIVRDWETLRNDAEKLGLVEACQQLDEMWKVLNPKAVVKHVVPVVAPVAVVKE